MDNNQILYAVNDDKCVFKLVGKIRYMMSTCFNKAIEMIFSEHNIKTFIIDLTKTTYIDSTSLGLVAKIALFCYNQKLKKPVLLSTNNEVTEVIKSMGFEQAFVIISKIDKDNDDNFISVNCDVKSELNDTMLEAHQILMDMNENNRDKFKNVVDLLKKSTK
ncbi:STAS domain-containing protein [bacterium]|nr:STAS domain-containing protein [bacterium]